MKKIKILSLLLLLTLTFSFTTVNEKNVNNIEIYSQNSYCKGWETGFCNGYKEVKGIHAICPIAPLCPTPEINKNTYQDGYNRGFIKGMSYAKK